MIKTASALEQRNVSEAVGFKLSMPVENKACVLVFLC